MIAALVLLAAFAPARAGGGEPAHSAELDAMIIRAAHRHGVPERLLRRIVMRESRYNPRARNRAYWGLMQISYPTARSMGFHGSPEQLLNPLTNLTYAVPYLANAFLAAGKQEDAAVRLYASGYYDTARRRGLLGLLRTADSSPLANVPEPTVQADAAPSQGFFGSLIGSSPSPEAEAAAQVAPTVTPVATLASGTPAAQGVPPVQLAADDAAPRGRHGGRTAVLVADRSGRVRPPAGWLHDGGLTLLAKGEQGDERFAATRPTPPSSSRTRKDTTFASLDAATPPAAQAYVASGSATAPQAAIAGALAPADRTGEKAAPEAAEPGSPARRHRHRASRHPGRDDAKRAPSETAAPPS